MCSFIYEYIYEYIFYVITNSQDDIQYNILVSQSVHYYGSGHEQYQKMLTQASQHKRKCLAAFWSKVIQLTSFIAFLFVQSFSRYSINFSLLFFMFQDIASHFYNS